VVAGTALGAVLSVATGRQAGLLIGFFLVASTACAVLGVRPRAVYLVIPVPVMTYVTAAMVTGMITDEAASTSISEFLIGALQWVASGFIAMIIATVIAIVTAVVRRPRRPPGERPPGARPPGAEPPWATHLPRPR
jgi:NADH:ubiquinone oxidoreductase subunit 6 (subunit J)